MTNDLSGFSVAQDDQNQPSAAPNAVLGSDDGVPTQPSDGSVVLPQQPITQGQQPAYGSLAKEQMEAQSSFDAAEKVPIVETRENEAVPEEVSSWIEKLEQGEDIQLPQPVVQDDQVLVAPATPAPEEVKIVLPMTQEEVAEGLHQKVFTGARWLAEWCVRLVKKFHGHVMYRLNQAGGKSESA